MLLDGALVHDAADQKMGPGKFTVVVFGDAHVFADKVEYLDLDGASEPEALALLGIGRK